MFKVKEIRLLNDKLLNSRKVVEMRVKKKLKTQILIKKLKWHQFILRFKILSKWAKLKRVLKETLQNILSMLDNTSEGKQKTKIQEIHKIDEPNTSAVMDSESMEKTVELKVIVEDADNDLNVKEKAKKAVSSDEFSSSDSSVRNILS